MRNPIPISSAGHRVVDCIGMNIEARAIGWQQEGERLKASEPES